MIIDENAATFECVRFICRDKSENLGGVIGVKLLIAKDSLQANCVLAFLTRFNPVVSLATVNSLDLEQLVVDLFTFLQVYLFGFLIEYKIRHTVNNLI